MVTPPALSMLCDPDLDEDPISPPLYKINAANPSKSRDQVHSEGHTNYIVVINSNED